MAVWPGWQSSIVTVFYWIYSCMQGCNCVFDRGGSGRETLRDESRDGVQGDVYYATVWLKT